MTSNITQSEEFAPKWILPEQVLKLQRLKLKKKKLQTRLETSVPNASEENSQEQVFPKEISLAIKRTNPFIKDREAKRFKCNSFVPEESSDQTLFQLFHLSDDNVRVKTNQPTSFANVLLNLEEKDENCKNSDLGSDWIPIDWSLKHKVRLISSKPFVWNQKLKVSEEASGITAFVRCLDNNCVTTLDTSPNSKFHQCCFYWQHPSLPWLDLFPRSKVRVATVTQTGFASNTVVRNILQRTWADSFRSLFHLLKTRQCPYFYIYANNFTIVFRAAGICGYTEMNALIAPTTRGLRQLLRQEDIEFTMPLKSKRESDCGYETLDDVPEIAVDEDKGWDTQWLQGMGASKEEIKLIEDTHAKLAHKLESEVDNSEQSLVVIEGMEVNGLYNFLLNCKSLTAATGPLAGIPPTLLSPVAFNAGTLSAFTVKESKIQLEDANYFSLEIGGPILPHFVHDLFSLHSKDQNLSITFATVNSTTSFSKVKLKQEISNNENQYASGTSVFHLKNLSDCGLNQQTLRYFCSSDGNRIVNVDSLRYNAQTKMYTWM